MGAAALIEASLADAAAAPLLEGLAAEYARRYGDSDVAELSRYALADFDPPHGATVLVVEDDRTVAGGALRRYGVSIAEIKRMWTAPDARRRGHGARVLAWLEQAATERGYASLRLETGTEQPEAVALYQRAGYRRIAPYGPYRGDPRTICFEKLLAAPVDARGRLEEEPFGYRVTKDDRVLISFRGRQVTVVAGARGARLAGELEAAGGDASRVQMLLAKATGNFKHGNER